MAGPEGDEEFRQSCGTNGSQERLTGRRWIYPEGVKAFVARFQRVILVTGILPAPHPKVESANLSREGIETMRCELRRLLVLSCLAAILSFLPMAAPALILVHQGNDPVRNMGWPDGAEEVANLPERLGFEVGSVGRQYHFRYRCRDTAQFNEALQRFGAIRTPRIGREMFTSLDGRNPRIGDAKPLLLVVHDRPKAQANDKPTSKPVEQAGST